MSDKSDVLLAAVGALLARLNGWVELPWDELTAVNGRTLYLEFKGDTVILGLERGNLQ